jgi:hypothetical protein
MIIWSNTIPFYGIVADVVVIIEVITTVVAIYLKYL